MLAWNQWAAIGLGVAVLVFAGFIDYLKIRFRERKTSQIPKPGDKIWNYWSWHYHKGGR